MKASEAVKKSIHATKISCHKSINDTGELIEKAAAEGKFSLSFGGVLQYGVKRFFLEEGYKVDSHYDSERGNLTLISW